MTRYIWHDGTWWPTAKHPPKPSLFPSVISDHMDPVMHPCTGQLMDSKSAFRAVTRANGCVELGNDAPTSLPAPPKDDIAADIALAWQKLEQGYEAPPPPDPPELAHAPVRTYE